MAVLVTAGAASGGRVHPGLRVLEEALRLLDAAQVRPPANPPADHANRSDHAPSWDVHDHAEPAECRFCPVCRALAAVRATNPEAVARMGRAVSDLVGALADLVSPTVGEPGDLADDTREPSEPPTPPRPQPVRVQPIDITDER